MQKLKPRPGLRYLRNDQNPKDYGRFSVWQSAERLAEKAEEKARRCRQLLRDIKEKNDGSKGIRRELYLGKALFLSEIIEDGGK